MHPAVALAIPHSREIVWGISQFLAQRERWCVDWVPHWALRLDPGEWRRWQGDGLIIQATEEQPIAVLRGARVPIVSVSDDGWDGLWPTVHSDNRAIGRLGAEHFLDRGFRVLLFVGSFAGAYARERWQGFAEYAEAHGARVESIDYRPRGDVPPSDFTLQRIREMPRPLGVMAAGDTYARAVARLCLQDGIAVPESVALLGVDNDELLCNLDLVPLSSVVPDQERVGREAAALLTAMLEGARPEPVVRLIPPRGIVTRQSTDVVHHEDTSLREAMRFVLENVSRPIGVQDIADHVGVSRRTLDRRFRQFLGRAPAEELLLLRLNLARRLLGDPLLSIGEVASRSGFTDQWHFGRCFRQRVGLSPSAFRQQLLERETAPPAADPPGRQASA